VKKQTALALLLVIGCSGAEVKTGAPGAGGGNGGGVGNGGNGGGVGNGGSGGGVGSGGGGGSRGTGGAGGSAGGGMGGSGGAPGIGGSGGRAGSGGAGGGAGVGGNAVDGGPGGSGGRDAAPAPPDAGPPPSGNPFVYVSGYAPSITTLVLDGTTGLLTRAGSVTVTGRPSYLAFSPNTRFLYAIDESSPSRIVSFAIDRATGALTQINAVATMSNGAAHLAVHPSGNWIVAPHYLSGDVTVHAVRADGSVDPPMASDSPGAMAHQAVFDSSGTFLFVPLLGSNAVEQYQFAAGRLTRNAPPSVPVPGGPRHMAFGRGEDFAYVVTENSSTIITFRFDKTAGLLSAIETLPTTAAGREGATAHLVLHPSGQFLYVSNRNDNSITLFSIDSATGRLQNQGYTKDMISVPRDFTIDPAGHFLLVANQNSANVVVFQIDPTNGTLTRQGAPATVSAMPSFVGAVFPH
jgi:6-phosphogluconolactonase